MKSRHYVFALMAMMLLVFNSCKKNTVDVTDLLKTVPSSAAGVVILNMESMIEDAGCKIKDNAVVPGKEVKAMLEKQGTVAQQDWEIFFKGDTGIDPRAAVVFFDSNRMFITFLLYDVDKFVAFVEKEGGSKFENESNSVKVCGNTALRGSQAWVCLSSHKRIDADAIEGYANLSTSQSFMVTPIGEKLLVEENDIRGWAKFDTFLNELPRSQRSSVALTKGFLFNDAESVKFKMDFEEGELEAEAIILNDEGKPAKYQLPADKVDVSSLKSLGGNCEIMMAFTVNSKLVKKLEQISAAFGGSIFGDPGELFKNVDGTIGLVSSGDKLDSAMKGFVTTKGEVSKDLRDIISRMVAPVSEDGKYLRFSKGEVTGNLSVEKAAEELKGSCFGMVIDASAMSGLNLGKDVTGGIQSFMLKFEPESGGLEIKIEVKSTNSKENFLKSMMSWN